MTVVGLDGKPTTVDGLGKAIDEMTARTQEVDAKAALWAKNFEEFTGYRPNQPITALDVVKIMHRFYGEPKGD